MTAAEKLFTTEDRRRISLAVAEAELRTGAEIVPVVARASGRYDRPESHAWDAVSPAWQLVGLLAAVAAGFIAGAVAGSRVHWLRRLFTPQRQMTDEVLARAKQVFFDRSVRRTLDGTGVLIFVSMFERRAAILADQTVVDKLGQSLLDELCGRLTANLSATSPTEALCDAIAAAGERLSSAIPRRGDDVNELSDALVVLD